MTTFKTFDESELKKIMFLESYGTAEIILTYPDAIVKHIETIACKYGIGVDRCSAGKISAAFFILDRDICKEAMQVTMNSLAGEVLDCQWKLFETPPDNTLCFEVHTDEESYRAYRLYVNKDHYALFYCPAEDIVYSLHVLKLADMELTEHCETGKVEKIKGKYVGFIGVAERLSTGRSLKECRGLPSVPPLNIPFKDEHPYAKQAKQFITYQGQRLIESYCFYNGVDISIIDRFTDDFMDKLSRAIFGQKVNYHWHTIMKGNEIALLYSKEDRLLYEVHRFGNSGKIYVTIKLDDDELDEDILQPVSAEWLGDITPVPGLNLDMSIDYNKLFENQYLLRQKLPRNFKAVCQWFKNGDHIDDKVHPDRPEEGRVVRYYRTPEVGGSNICPVCEHTAHDHGWIDQGGGGCTVCPGDWILTDVNDNHYIMKPDVFERLFNTEK